MRRSAPHVRLDGMRGIAREYWGWWRFSVAQWRAARLEMLRQCPGVGNQSQFLGDGGDVMVSVATQSAPGCGVQIGGLDDNEMKPVGRDELVASRVIDGSLLTSMDPAHC